MPTSLSVQGRTGSGRGSEEHATQGSPLDESDGTHRKESDAVSYVTTVKVAFLVNIAHSEKGEGV
jgi:hypothetical protein